MAFESAFTADGADHADRTDGLDGLVRNSFITLLFQNKKGVIMLIIFKTF